ncbi:MAG: hypothetical protein B6D61_04895 [Bacteroidetes bacterium 4484_249]|nr:MAG: hypothetical protein B6D61_04895 [Bacteroidetes bacterium 4484_249]
MAKYLFKSAYENKTGLVNVRLLLFHFIDENNIHFIYSPHLDLTGYGNSLADAKKSFEIVFEDFVDYTLKKRTIGKVLTGLGWEIKGNLKKPKKILAPSITSAIQENNYVSEIFDKYPVNTYHQEVGIPAYA